MFWWKGALQNWILSRFFCTQPFVVFFARFCFDFSQKSNEITIKKEIYCFIAALVFLNMATFTKHRILRYEATFCFLSVFRIFVKNVEKMPPKFKDQFVSQKSPKNGVRGPILESKFVPDSRERSQKSLKLTELPESPDDPRSEILRERSSERKAPGNALPEEVLFQRPRGPIL